jgi:hypothetical protein
MRQLVGGRAMKREAALQIDRVGSLQYSRAAAPTSSDEVTPKGLPVVTESSPAPPGAWAYAAVPRSIATPKSVSRIVQIRTRSMDRLLTKSLIGPSLAFKQDS